MAELTFLGLSEDGLSLLLADSRGRKHSVAIDPRLMAAMRANTRPTGQREIALNAMLSPREIQARLRAGATVEELAEETGAESARIERFAGPPLAERAHHADLARQTVMTSHLGERPLGMLLATAAEAAGATPSDIRWDAWLREDGRWQILTSFPVGAVDQVATWVFDVDDVRVEPDDDGAATLVTGPRGAARLTSVPESPGESSAGTKPATSKPRKAPTAEAAPVTVEEEELPRTRRGRRASVPTWDEILFGSQASPEDPDEPPTAV